LLLLLLLLLLGVVLGLAGKRRLESCVLPPRLLPPLCASTAMTTHLL
jgi:hypothetical protein